MSATESMIGLNQSKARRGVQAGWPATAQALARLDPTTGVKVVSSNPVGAEELGISMEEGAALLEVVSRLYHSSAETFPAQLLTGLGGLIPFELGGCHIIDRDY